MSASHSETAHSHEAVEAGHNSESVLETLGEGVGKIIDSVRIAIGKLYKTATGFFKDVLKGLFSNDDHGAHGHGTEAHGAHTENHDAHGATHASAAAAHH